MNRDMVLRPTSHIIGHLLISGTTFHANHLSGAETRFKPNTAAIKLLHKS